MSHGRGAEIWDVDGNRFLDFAAGIAVCSTGHCHPARGRGDQGSGRAVPAHLAPTTGTRRRCAWASASPRLAPMGEPAHELLLPIGHRGRRGRAQARALRHRPAAVHRLPRRLPRPHDGLAGVHLEQVHPAEGLLPDHAGRDARAVSQPLPAALRRRGPGPGGARLHRARAVRAEPAAVRGGGDPGRADPGRGRLPGAARWLPCRACARCATSTASC